MNKALTLFALLNPMQAVDFTTYTNGSLTLQYKVEGAIAEYIVSPIIIQNRTACASFFGIAAFPPTGFTAPQGFKVDCTNVLNNQAQIKLTNLPQEELDIIAAGHKNYIYNVQNGLVIDPNVAAAFPNTCLGNCPVEYAQNRAKILTYNTYSLKAEELGQIASDNAWNNPKAAEIAAKLAEFDIVGIQELYTPDDDGRKFKFLQDAAAVGLNYYALPMSVLPAKQGTLSFTNDGGQLILSRYPIAEHDFSLYNRKSGQSASARGV